MKKPDTSRQDAAEFIHEVRELCGLSVQEVEGAFKTPVLKGKLEKLERNDSALGKSIYRKAMGEVYSMCMDRAPVKTSDYQLKFERLHTSLKP